MKLFHSTIALAVMGTLFAGSAQASVTFISSAFDSAPTAPQVMVVDFDNPNAPGYTITGGEIHITPLVPGIAAPPAGDTTQYLAVLEHFLI